MSEQTAKIVKVIDEYRVVINKGHTDGVKPGDRYLVYEIGEELFDPDTKESLGVLEIIKGKGRATHVQQRIATLETYEKERRRTSLGPAAVFGMDRYDEFQKSFDDPKIDDLAVKVDY